MCIGILLSLQPNKIMMKKITALLLLIGFTLSAQTITRIPGPVGSGLDATDRGLVPITVRDNYMYCYTTRMIGTVQRWQVVRLNLTTEETLIYNAPGLTGAAYFWSRPREFQFYNNDIYFLCGTRLNKIDTLTNTVSEIAQYCELVYVFKHYLIYNYNYTNTYVRNLMTNTTTELKSNGSSSFGSFAGCYEYNNQLYFKSGYSRIERFLPPSSTAPVYTAPYQSSNLYPEQALVTRVNDNLIYLLLHNGALKFVSVNLTTNTVNPNFIFDTLEQYATGVCIPFVLNNQVYLTNDNGVYVSNGSGAPVLTGLPFKTFYPTLFRNQAFGIVYNDTYGPEFWKTDGTLEGSGILKDINPGPQGINTGAPVVYNNALFFSAENSGNSLNGWRIYTSDGTENNTLPITPPDYFTTESRDYGAPMIPYNNYLYFYADTGTEYGLYKMDITAYNLGTNENSTKPALFYPNPTNGKIYTDAALQSISVYSLKGEMIYKSENLNEVNLASFPTGIYLVKSVNAEGIINTQRIIRE